VILPELKAPAGGAGALAPHLQILCCTGHVFAALTRDGRRFATELQVQSAGNACPAHLELSVGPVICGARV
jgi:hypothetical protein